MNKNVAKSIKSVLANMALLVFCLIYLSPIYIIVVNSFKSRAEMYTNVLALPETLTWEYYAGAVQRMDFINVFKIRSSLRCARWWSSWSCAPWPHGCWCARIHG